METEEVFEAVCRGLGFSESSGFVTVGATQVSLKHWQVLQEAQHKLKIDAIYFSQTAPGTEPSPVIYFKKFGEVNPRELQELHRRIWNQGRAPILFAITPGEVLIYDCFEPPPQTDSEAFDNARRLVQRVVITESTVLEEQIRRELKDYARQEFDIGSFWQKTNYRNRFNTENRADQHLIRNLSIIRKTLTDGGLSYESADSLIGRSIFILYLQDSGALGDFYVEFENHRYSDVRDVLLDKEDTYKLFRALRRQFDGDMFPLTDDEESQVKPTHLQELSEFLRYTDLRTRQRRLWPYRFDVIPIEFISTVYEEFVQHQDIGSADRGTFYTPSFLVEFLLDQVLPERIGETTRILDPSCGSGIFLVASFRKLVALAERKNGRQLTVQELQSIMQNCLFGVDINAEALRVAAFSLYLTMLDYMEPKSLMKYHDLFPPLIGHNLVQCDFLHLGNRLKGEFDVVIGNVPWASTLSEKDVRFFERRGQTIGDRQLAQAFLWTSLTYAGPNTRLCLIVTAKGVLFNQSSPNKEFRSRFLKEVSVNSVLNFAALRHEIFKNAVGPAAAIVYSRRDPEQDKNKISYVVPKPSMKTRKMGVIVVDHSDIKHISRDLVLRNDRIWKSAMWGTPRDWALLESLKSTPSLRDVIRRYGLTVGEGFRKNGNERHHAAWVAKLPFLSLEKFEKFHVPRDGLSDVRNYVPDLTFDRPRSPARYTAPLCLIKENPDAQGRVVSAYSQRDVCFNEHIISIAGSTKQARLLKTLVSIMNSALIQYVLFLTSSHWGVERDYVLLDDHLNLPIALPEGKGGAYPRLVQLHDKLAALASEGKQDAKIWRESLDELDKEVFRIYRLSTSEQAIVRETVRYTMDFFKNQDESVACSPADESILRNYAVSFVHALNPILRSQGSSLKPTIFTGTNGLVVVSFELEPKNEWQPTIVDNLQEMERVDTQVYGFLTDEVPDSIQYRRILRIFGDKVLCYAKPNEVRYWTRTSAFNDADEVIADGMKSWREEQFAQ